MCVCVCVCVYVCMLDRQTYLHLWNQKTNKHSKQQCTLFDLPEDTRAASYISKPTYSSSSTYVLVGRDVNNHHRNGRRGGIHQRSGKIGDRKKGIRKVAQERARGTPVIQIIILFHLGVQSAIDSQHCATLGVLRSSSA